MSRRHPLIPAAPLLKGSREIAERTLATGRPKPVSMTLTDLTPGARFIIETLDEQNGFALRKWQALGSLEPPTREPAATLREEAMAVKKDEVRADETGILRLDLTLTPWSVVLAREVVSPHSVESR